MLRKLRPRSAYDVFGVLALFVALGGTAYAATGGNFILGQGNTASSTTSLTAPVAGKALQLTNPSTGSGASALGLTVDSGKPPLTTNSSTKVDNLNADRLDGHDSSYFLPVFGKAADANTLDGIDSSGFIHGQGRILTLDQNVPSGGPTPAVDIPGLATIFPSCGGTTGQSVTEVQAPDNTSVDLLADEGGANPSHAHLAGGAGAFFNIAASGDDLTLSLESGGSVATVFAFSYAFHNPVLNRDFCKFQGHVIMNGT